LQLIQSILHGSPAILKRAGGHLRSHPPPQQCAGMGCVRDSDRCVANGLIPTAPASSAG